MKAHSAGPVLQVSDLNRAVKYYSEILGFAEDFRFGNYAGVRNGEAMLHLCGHTVHNRPLGGGAAFIICDEVNSYFADIKQKGAIVKVEPSDEPYGMRDFIVLDPDGNHLTFGTGLHS